MASTKIEGLADMRTNFEKIGKDMQTRTARRAVVAGGRIIKNEAIAIARANGSVRTGDMVKNIAIKRERKAGSGVEQYHIGVRHGREQTKKVRSQGNKSLAVNGRGRIVTRRDNDPYYWKWVEFGHKIVPRRSRNDKRSISRRRKQADGEVAGKPFIGPALERKSTEAIKAMSDAIAAELAKGAGGT